VSWQIVLALGSLSCDSRSHTHNASVPPPSDLAALPLPPTEYRHRIPQAVEHTYPTQPMPHLDTSASAWHKPRRCSTHTYAILHTSSSLMDVCCRPSHCPPSVLATNSPSVDVSYIESCDHSNTKTATHLPTTKVNDKTNDLAHTPTDANTNLNARSTEDDSSQNTRCLSSSKC